jgi:hypothetical protein
MSGVAEVICGIRAPEDLELTPDGKFLLVPQYVTARGGAAPGSADLMIFDLAKKTFSTLAIVDDPLKTWGDSACPGPIGKSIAAHGMSLTKRANGSWQLYVVNHGGRQSIEMYELKNAANGWAAYWHGCVLARHDYNDVVALPDGGFIATMPTSLLPVGGNTNLFGGQPTGILARWTPGKGEVDLPDTEMGYPNGVVISPDGRYLYIAAWTTKELFKYDLRTSKRIGKVALDFMPDNISWTAGKQLLAAGVKATRGDCPEKSGIPCIATFGVAQVNPDSLSAKLIFDPKGQPLISGVSVAAEVGGFLYIGAFQGDRIVKVPKPK